MLRLWLALLLLILSSCLGLELPIGSPGDAGVILIPLDDGVSEQPPLRIFTVIEDVEVAVVESNPVQLRLHVTGYQPDGCEYPVQVEQSREGRRVYVDIYREVSPWTCVARWALWTMRRHYGLPVILRTAGTPYLSMITCWT